MTHRVSWQRAYYPPRHADVADEETATELAEALAGKGWHATVWVPGDEEDVA